MIAPSYLPLLLYFILCLISNNAIKAKLGKAREVKAGIILSLCLDNDKNNDRNVNKDSKAIFKVFYFMIVLFILRIILVFLKLERKIRKTKYCLLYFLSYLRASEIPPFRHWIRI